MKYVQCTTYSAQTSVTAHPVIAKTTCNLIEKSDGPTCCKYFCEIVF